MKTVTEVAGTSIKTEYFGSLTNRMNKYREDVLDKKPYIDAERAVLATKAYQEHREKPNVLKRAYMLKEILENMTLYIEEESLIAGNQASSNKDAPIFPEYTLEFVLNELDLFEKRDGDVFYITEETKEQLRSIAPFWEKNNLRSRAGVLLPEEVQVYMETGFFGMEGKMNSGDAHLAVNYQKVLEQGLRGFEERVREAKAKLDLTDPASIDKYHFYDSIFIIIDSVKAYADRFVALATELAEKAPTAQRRQELLEIARICAKVPYEPAETFAEAVQSVWFIQCILQIESNGHSLSYGRFDQYMYPYVKADLEAGRETEDSIVERLTNLWIKTITINKVRSQSHTFSSAGSPLYQNVTIGGQTRDKKDAVNPLSYLVLKSVAQTHLPQPNLTVRYHAGLDARFMNECIEVMKLGFGMPAFNNDEIIIPSFIEKGVLEEDAYDYSAIGCVETAVPGKWGYRCTGMSYMNFPKVLLITMNDGIDPASGKRFAPAFGHFKDMKSFEELETAWEKTLRHLTRMSVIVENAIDIALEREVPDILCSALTDDCIGRGKHLKEGGAIYDYISGLQVGIANLSDSLAAIKKMDKNGPTSVLKSVAKLPTHEIVGGVLLNQKVNPQTLAKEEDKQKLIALLRTFFNRLHGYHIQYNVVSRETLIDAQLHPEKHRDLIVRVAGYSAFFNVLSRATQDDIIGRTEHTL
ncbi:TPA: glycyl radical protein [Streptococcus suis]|nr:glycyl radical protein [Streptococcus suis]